MARRRMYLVGVLALCTLLVTGCDADLRSQCMGVGDPDREQVETIDGDGSLSLDWENLRNPVLSADARIKDQAVAYHDGWFHAFASGAGSFRSRDLVTWERIGGGLGSPDLVRAGDRWIIVHQDPDAIDPGPEGDHRKLVWRESTDLLNWSEDRDLIDLPHDRNIDGALAVLDPTGDTSDVVLAYKRGILVQETRIAHGRLTEEGFEFDAPAKAYAGEGCFLNEILPIIGDTITQWAENFQMIEIDGRWRVIATARHPDRPIDFGYVASHEPFIYEIEDGDWRHWMHKRHLIVPEEDWNTVMHANTAFVVDMRARDGWFYLFYSGADALDPDGRGHSSIGVVRSRDLVDWYVPGDMTGT